jgi:dihydroneopterin aldolase
MTDSPKDSEKITLANMEFSGFVGVSEREHEQKTRIEVDVEISADLSEACKSDSLDGTIDYSRMYDLAAEVVASRHHNLLESLAEEIADAAFGLDGCEKTGGCEKVIVRVRKPKPPVGGECGFAEVEIVRYKANRRKR